MTKSRFNFGLDRFSGLYLWAIFIVVFTFWAPKTFPKMPTVHLLASTQAVAGIIAIAVLIPMICGQFDLSVGGVANLTGLVAAEVQVKEHWSLLPTIVLAIAIGVLIGVVNGFVVVVFKVSSFIATLGMGSVLSAFAVIVTGSVEPPGVASTAWNDMTQYKIFGFQVIIYYLLAFALIAWWVIEFTPVGRHLRAAGGNPDAARLSGIRVNRLTWGSLIASGSIAGVGGILYVSLTGPSLTFGPTLLLPAFAAAFLGSTQLQPGRFNVWGSMLAIFVLATGVQGFQLVSGAQWVGDMFNGVALILAVALAASRQNSGFRLPWRRNDSGPPVSDDASSAAAHVAQARPEDIETTAPSR